MTGISFYHKLNGRTTRGIKPLVNKRIACALTSANYWSSSENNSNNAWNVNFSGGNSNNNNKNNTNRVRAVAALDDDEKASVMEAYEDCCRHKMSSHDCIQFRLHPEQIIELAIEIKERRYEPGYSSTFIVKIPKLREIFAAHFRDRIVQHWIYLRLNPLFEKRFQAMGNVSYNCRKGFGTLAARQNLYGQMHKYGFGGKLFVGKYDISSYFMSIDLNVLWEKLEPFIQEQYHGKDKDLLLYLTKITVFHRPQEKCIRKGDLSLWSYLPKSKSLFGKDEHTGMAIGNLTTQMLCNFYLSFFDEWMLNRIAQLGYDNPKEHYDRFVDDFINHSMAVEHITLLHREAEGWLKENLHLKLHPTKVYIQPQRHGVTFVGGVVKPGRVYIINRTIGAMTEKVKYIDKLCRVIVEYAPTEKRLAILQSYMSSINSYSGFLRHGNTYNIQKRMLLNLQWFWKICYTKANLSVVKVKRDYKLNVFLLKEEERKRRIMKSFRPHCHTSFPDERYLRRVKIW